MTAGKLTVGADGKLRGPAKIEYNNPFPCENGNYNQGGPGKRGVLMHTMVCDLPLCIRIFNKQTSPPKEASAHFGIAQDGQIWQFGPIGKGWDAWHAGNGNATWYGIEHADHGNPDNPLTDAQKTASAQVVECLSAFANFPLQVTDSPSGRGYGTHVMGGLAWSPDRHTCPDSTLPGQPGKHTRSRQRDDIIAEAKQIRAGDSGSSGGGAVTGQRFTMYDDVNVSLLPPGGDAYACYVGGTYANCPQVRAKFPDKQIVTIAVTSTMRAMFLDVEPGDATNSVASGWMRDQKAADPGGVVGVYTSAGNAAALMRALAAGGHPRSSYKLWSAHYGFGEHVCGTGGCTYPRADATQWTHQSHSRELDQSLCEPDFLGTVQTSAPAATTEDDEEMSRELPQTVGETITHSWVTGSAKGYRIATDPQGGDVTFAIQELHLDPNERWVEKDDITTSGGWAKVNFATPDDCTAVAVTLKKGTGSSSGHPMPS